MKKKELIFYITYFVVVISFIVLSIIPSPVNIKNGGGIEKVRYGTKEPRFYSAHVKYKRPSYLMYLLSYVYKGYEREEKVVMNPSKMKEEELDRQGKLQLDLAYNMALVMAYKKAGKPLDYKVNIYVYESKLSDVHPGDIVKSINGEEDFTKFKVVADRENTLILKRKDKEVTVKYKASKDSYKLLLIKGPKVKDHALKMDRNAYGASAGLAYAVSIYNNLIKEDLTHGKKIVLTGVVFGEDHILEVGGIDDKVKGAIKAGADIFIMPLANKKDADKYKDKIKIVYVKNFDEAIKFLESLNG